MFVFKNTYTDRNGKTCQSSKWYVQVIDATGARRRLPAFASKPASESLGRNIERLVSLKVSGEPLPTETTRWLESLPKSISEKLGAWGLLSTARITAGKTLLAHLQDWQNALTAKENNARYVGMKVSRARKVIDGCRFVYHADIAGSKVADYLHGLREGEDGISAQTYNHYLQATKQFLKWMQREGRATANPIDHLQGLNVRTDRRHDHRPLTLEEIPHLLAAAEHGRVIRGLSGAQRALLYRIAIETGARAAELLSVKREDFRLDADPPTLTLQAGYTKARRTDSIPLKGSTAFMLRDVLSDVGKGELLFGGVRAERVRLAEAIKADLEAARDAWLQEAKTDKQRQEREETDFLVFKDSAGRFADFHGLRHTCGSLLAAGGVHPAVAMEILRHSDVRLTMNIYTHSYAGPVADAVNGLPDFAAKPATEKKPKEADAV